MQRRYLGSTTYSSAGVPESMQSVRNRPLLCCVHNAIVVCILLACTAGLPAAAQIIWPGAGVAPPIIANPAVSVVAGGQSSWDWSIIAPQQPVQPNPLPLGQPGTLVYQVNVFKNANGKVPQGTFTITAQVLLRTFGPPTAFGNVFVMLSGQGMNNRYNAVSCEPGDRVAQWNVVVTCYIRISNLNLRGQAAGRTVSFTGYNLQAFATYNLRLVNDSEVAASVPRSGQVAGVLTPITIPSSNDDCATLTQIFDAAAVLPISVNTVAGPTLQAVIQRPVSFNPTPVCQSQNFVWTATFQFTQADCRGSTSPAYQRQILSNFKLEPGLVAGISRQQPLVFDVMTNAAYLVCNRPNNGQFASVKNSPAVKRNSSQFLAPIPKQKSATKPASQFQKKTKQQLNNTKQQPAAQQQQQQQQQATKQQPAAQQQQQQQQQAPKKQPATRQQSQQGITEDQLKLLFPDAAPQESASAQRGLRGERAPFT